MQVEIRYFALLREAVGRASETLDVPEDVANVGALRAWLVAKGEPWAGAFANLKRVRAARNDVMVGDEEPVEAGDVVAFFPPVTGG